MGFSGRPAGRGIAPAGRNPPFSGFSPIHGGNIQPFSEGAKFAEPAIGTTAVQNRTMI